MYNLLILLVIFLLNINSFAKEGVITVASTTSTHDTGLLKSINKEFTNKFNIKVNVISLGTGQAIRIAKDGNVEILLVHHTPSELLFMKNGYGKVRHDLMYNDFVIVGPKTDTKKCNTIPCRHKDFNEQQKANFKGIKANQVGIFNNNYIHIRQIEVYDVTGKNIALNNCDIYILLC